MLKFLDVKPVDREEKEKKVEKEKKEEKEKTEEK